jgi:hypothetical protein
MTQAAPEVFKIPTKSPQPAVGKAARLAGRAESGRPASGRVLANGTGRAATRGDGEVIELECGIAVYPARGERGRWRAVWYENGERQQCEGASEGKLAAKLEKVTERLRADAPYMARPGYLDRDTLIALWPELYPPRGVRQAWEEHHPQLRAGAAGPA